MGDTPSLSRPTAACWGPGCKQTSRKKERKGARVLPGAGLCLCVQGQDLRRRVWLRGQGR